MSVTKLLYLEDMCKPTCHARILEIRYLPDMQALVLDQTVFYPQGGGQPADKGYIKNDLSTFDVQGVTKEGETVLHKGVITHGQMFHEHDAVVAEVNPEIRLLHNRNHTGGHMIDYALFALGYALTPNKAYHFPQGPYIECNGTLDEIVLQELRKTLEPAVNALIQKNLPVAIGYINNDPKKRTMSIPGFEPILCGGTHVLSTGEVGRVSIRKIKNEKGNVRVSYACS